MIQTIGNPELEFLFEEDSFKNKRRSEKERRQYRSQNPPACVFPRPEPAA